MKDYETMSDRDLLPYIEENIANTLIQQVLCNLLNYYTKTATLCRKFYYISAALMIVLPTLVTIVSSLASMWDMQHINVFTAITAGIAAIISGFNSLFKWQENWLRYRMGVEQLKKESINYIAGVGKYQDANKDIHFLMVIQKIADEMNTKEILQYGKTSDLLNIDEIQSE